MSWIIRNFEKLIGAVSFSIMLLMVIVNVFSRYFLGHSFNYTEEIAFIGFTYCVFFGICVLYKKHALISIDVIVGRLPEKAHRIVRIFNFSLLSVLNIVLAVLSTKLSIEAWVRPTAALRIPYTFIDMSATISFILMTFYSVRFLIKSITGKEKIDFGEELYLNEDESPEGSY